MSKVYLPILLALILAAGGCATQEFSQARASCEAEAWGHFPGSLTQKMVTVTRSVPVPDGNVSCTSNYSYGSVRTNCTQGTTYQAINENVVQTVDLNAASRQSYIRTCTERKCLVEYGNEQCEPNARLSGDHERPRTMMCQTDSDCGSGKSCRSRSGGGTICRQID